MNIATEEPCRFALITMIFKMCFKKSFIFPSICYTESKDICDDFHLKYLSSTRKIMRDYNDNLQDGVYEDKDRGPCETCKRCITNECDGLIQELEKLNGLQLVSAGACRCMYYV